MSATRFGCLLVLFLGTLSGLAGADSLDLRNGQHVHGKYVGGTAGVIAFSCNGAVQYFSVKDVLALVFTDTDEENTSENFLPQSFNPSSEGDTAPKIRPWLGRSVSHEAVMRTGRTNSTSVPEIVGRQQ